jgi:hypothetical protein
MVARSARKSAEYLETLSRVVRGVAGALKHFQNDFISQN